MAKLNENQRQRAWKLLMKGGDNRDATIAKKIGHVTAKQVSEVLAEMEKIKMDRINKGVNERHEIHEKRQAERLRAKANRAMEIQTGE